MTQTPAHRTPPNALTIDVEDWFHILDSSAAPPIEKWDALESHIVQNTEKVLETLADFSVKATFFWLSWAAERHKSLVKKCYNAGHEIASHGYAHVLAYKVEPKIFRDDIRQSKAILEDIIGKEVKGFRAAGFGINSSTLWAFDEICAAGYLYDSSVFPSSRGHGGMTQSPMGPYIIETTAGDLLELPMSTIEIFRKRLCIFGGGYLRISPIKLVRWGIEKLHAAGRPLIVYLHPREFDPNHPRLALNPKRYFKCYINLRSAMPKFQWLCKNYEFLTMNKLAKHFNSTFEFDNTQVTNSRLHTLKQHSESLSIMN